MPQRGFSLIELMVILAILAITLSLAVPAFQSTIQAKRIASQTRDFTSTLQMARSEAGTRKTDIIISNISNDWTNGYRVWEDANGNTNYNAGEEIVEVGALEGQTGLAITSGGNPINQFIFNRSGFLASPAANITVDMIAHDCTGTNRRAITISVSGRVDTSAVSCN